MVGGDSPFTLGSCSNGEFVPPPPSPVARETARRVNLEADRLARRLGMSRRRFLSSVCGSALTLLTLDACSRESTTVAPTSPRGPTTTTPGGTFVVPQTATTEPEAAIEIIGGEEFVLDVQAHLLDFDLTTPEPEQFFGSAFPQAACGEDDRRACFGLETFLGEIFLRSDTNAVILSAVPIFDPAGPLSPDVMARAVRTAETLCRDDRVWMQGEAAPALGSPAQARDRMTELADRHPIVSWKTYTHSPSSFFLDDHDPGLPAVGHAFLRHAVELGVPIVAVHKGLSGQDPHASPVDVGPAAAANPDVRLVVYHSGYESGVAEGPYDPAAPNAGVDRLIASVEAAGLGPGANVYAELGSTWRAVMTDPTQAAHLLGKLLVAFGPDNVVWGTDSIWYGTPQDQIEAFRAFAITDEFQERFGYPALTDELKAKILGGNGARLFGIDPPTVRCDFTAEELREVRETTPIAYRTYGPRTAAEYRAHVATHGV